MSSLKRKIGLILIGIPLILFLILVFYPYPKFQYADWLGDFEDSLPIPVYRRPLKHHTDPPIQLSNEELSLEKFIELVNSPQAMHVIRSRTIYIVFIKPPDTTGVQIGYIYPINPLELKEYLLQINDN